MTAGERLAQRLIRNETVRRLVGNRVFPQMPEKDTACPYVVYRKVSGRGGRRLNGRNRLQPHLFRVDCYGLTQQQAEKVLDAVATALTNGWADRSAGVQGCFESEDQDDDLADAGEADYFVCGQSFELWCTG